MTIPLYSFLYPYHYYNKKLAHISVLVNSVKSCFFSKTAASTNFLRNKSPSSGEKVKHKRSKICIALFLQNTLLPSRATSIMKCNASLIAG